MVSANHPIFVLFTLFTCLLNGVFLFPFLLKLNLFGESISLAKVIPLINNRSRSRREYKVVGHVL
jgi:hypothetical protein